MSSTRTTIDPEIAEFYERAPEENRLEQGPFQLEEYRTRELIVRHAPTPPSLVLDVGGAGGAYAFWLAELGYTVHLIDAVPRLVDVADQRNRISKHPLASSRVGDARAIPFDRQSASLVLLLGPLYHLVNESDRHQALLEAARVLQPGGVLVAAGVSRYASALDGLSRDLLGDPEFAKIVEQDLVNGQHRNPTDRLDYFTTAYFHRPEDLQREVQRAGLSVIAVYGVEGPSWMLPDFMDRWNDPDRRLTMLYLARRLEQEPAVLGTSAHLLAVARKP